MRLLTQQLSQFLNSPTIIHYQNAYRVIKYLKGSPGWGILFKRHAQLQLLDFPYADWKSCIDTRRSSTSGYCFFLEESEINCTNSTILYCDNQFKYTFLQILFLLREQNTLKLIVIPFEKEFKRECSNYFQST